MTTATVPSVTDLEAVLDEVWSSFVGGPESLLPAGRPADEESTLSWTATVTISGEWRGMVSIDLGESVVHALTQGMLGLGDDDPLDDASCTDAVGELVNIVGGNVKSLMPGPSTLSLPVVSSGPVVVPSDLEETVSLHRAWCGTPMRVRVLTETVVNPVR